jgi:type II secretory pathway component PulF
MLLTYDAVDASGRTSTDAIEAGTVRDAVEQLRRRGLYVKKIAEKAGSQSRAALPAAAGRFKSQTARLPLKALVQVTRQLAMLLRAGSGLVPALAAVQRQLKNRAHAALLGQLVADLEEGTTLTEALRKHPATFDAVYCAIIAAGEASGALTEMFERLSAIVGKRRALRKKILGALAYPVLLIAMCVKILLVLLFFVLPRFNAMFVQLGVETPATTKILLDTSDALRSYWPVALCGVLVLIGGTVWTLTSKAGQQWLSDMQLVVPLLGRLRSRLIQGQIFRTMGMLLESRVDILETLDLVRESTRNRRFGKLFTDLQTAITSGGRLSTAFEESGIVEPYICQAIHTGEDTGNLGGAMTFCADMLDESNEELINVITKLIEPLILIGMGVVVGGVAISLFMPLFDMTSAIK